MTTPSASEPVLIDSWGWLEYMTEDKKADKFASYIEGPAAVYVPAIVMYEVYRKLLMSYEKMLAERFLSHAFRRVSIPLDEQLALAAAAASIDHKLAMADAIIYAAAQMYGARLITSDRHFRSLPGVTFI